MKKKQNVSLVLIITMMLTIFLPTELVVHAVPTVYIFNISEGNITVTGSADADKITVAFGNLGPYQIPKAEAIIITGTTTENKVVVDGVTANITIDEVDIQHSVGDVSAFNLINGADVTLTLVGDNRLKSSTDTDLTGNAGLGVGEGQTITIAGTGSLHVTGSDDAAGIGGARGDSANCGTVIIRSGTVTAVGGLRAAGIGGALESKGGTVTINDGTVIATGGAYGAGIGGGSQGGAESVTINDGTVTATGGFGAAGIGLGYINNDVDELEVAINGGTVNALGGSSTEDDFTLGGSGIGGGEQDKGTVKVTISGGIVNATGMLSGAGIGGGAGGLAASTVTISGDPTVTAIGGDDGGAGIGSGADNYLGHVTSAGAITISGEPTVTAIGGNAGGAGIGSGFESNVGTIMISGGTVTATGGHDGGAGIGSGKDYENERYPDTSAGTIIISEGTVIAIGGNLGGAGIGNGVDSDGGTITIGNSANVKAVSSSSLIPAIHTLSGALEDESTAKVLMANYIGSETADTAIQVYKKGEASLISSFAPSIGYQSIAFTVPENNTYQMKTGGVTQQHSESPDTSRDFDISKNGLTVFNHVTDGQSLWTDIGNYDTDLYDALLENTTGTTIEISTPQQLAAVARAVNNDVESFLGKTVVLSNNIDLNSHLWVPIGKGDILDSETGAVLDVFRGSFNGNKHTISNMNISAEYALAGLFGGVNGLGDGSEPLGIVIENVTVHGTINVSGQVAAVGGIAGMGGFVDFKNCNNAVSISVVSTVDGSFFGVAGILGIGMDTNITDCTNETSASITVESPKPITGGIIGFGFVFPESSEGESMIINSANHGAVTAKASVGDFQNNAGGIAGVFMFGSIINSYNTGDISTEGEVGTGGIAGLLALAEKPGDSVENRLKNSYSTGTLTADTGLLGGIAARAGFNVSDGIGDIEFIANSSYLDTTATSAYFEMFEDETTIPISLEGAAKTEEEMKGAAYLEALNTWVSDNSPVKGVALKTWNQAGGINGGYPYFGTVVTPVDAAAPTISSQPADVTINVGEEAILSLTATGTGTLSYQWYSNTENNSTSGSLIEGATAASYTAPTATAGETYYYCIATNTDNSATGNTTVTATSNAAKVTVNESSSNANLSALSLSSGTLDPVFASVTISYTASVANGISSITVTPTAADSNATVTVNGVAVISGNASGAISLNVGANTITVVVTAQDSTTKTYTLLVTRAAAASGDSSSSDNSGEGSTTTTPQPSQELEVVIVIVNDQEENAGKETRTTEDGKLTLTVEVDNKVIDSKIDEAIKNNTTGTGNVIQVPVTDTSSEVVEVQMTGDIVKKLEENHFNVSVKWNNVDYMIPSEEFTIGKAAEDLGVKETDLVDITVEVKITKQDETVMETYNNVVKANGAELVFPPVSFEVTVKTTKADGSTAQVNISEFSNFVGRVMEIPAGVDPGKITTGIVFNPDGTYSHVPTEVFQIDDKWYAKINSLTNSTYSVIWNPVTVKSAENHWAKDVVNDMASRLVVFNPESFEPNKGITRADFAEYIVRALGLYRKDTVMDNNFEDVESAGERTLAILIANEYGIVSGYPDGTFRPDALITREEAMTMYQKAMKVTKLTGSDTSRYQGYSDYGMVSEWATDYVREVLAARVFNGTTATTISPKSNLTYAEAAQAIKNLLVESKLINK